MDYREELREALKKLKCTDAVRYSELVGDYILDTLGVDDDRLVDWMCDSDGIGCDWGLSITSEDEDEDEGE